MTLTMDQGFLIILNNLKSALKVCLIALRKKFRARQGEKVAVTSPKWLLK
jgi:hypothetical protein